MSMLQVQLDRILRRRWWVLAVMAIALMVTVLYSVVQKPAYTSTWALRVDSQARGPEQDAVLAQGYVEYFNQPSSKQVLQAMAGLSAEVAFSARNSATSPIFYIEATAPTADLAVGSAKKLAETFREEINSQVRQSNGRTVADLRAQISAAQGRLTTVPNSSSEVPLILQEIESLQAGINDLQATTTNQLTDVFRSAGVSSTSPNVVLNSVLALAGGLILGVVAALALASAQDRRVTPAPGTHLASSRPSAQHDSGKQHDWGNGVTTQSLADGEESRA